MFVYKLLENLEVGKNFHGACKSQGLLRTKKNLCSINFIDSNFFNQLAMHLDLVLTQQIYTLENLSYLKAIIILKDL